MNRRHFLANCAIASAASPLFAARAQTPPHPPPSTGAEDRASWLQMLERIAQPVLANLAAGTLRARMPVETASGKSEGRRKSTHLEAFGRTVAGIAPWLAAQHGDAAEAKLRAELSDLTGKALRQALEPASPDYLPFDITSQSLVDASMLALGVLRAPQILWEPLEDSVRKRFVEALVSSRKIKPSESNWLLFSAAVEALLHRAGVDWKPEPIDRALRKHEEWYKGDGHYGDGPVFHWDYYNSFVIQPWLLAVLEEIAPEKPEYEAMRQRVLRRSRRYAEVLERLISPEGTFPAIGRSLAYRFGAFHLLSEVARREELPKGISPAQVRCALTAVLRRQMEAPGTFDADGWLTIGFCGHQPGLGESYISTGSLYACTLGFVALGLPPGAAFWSDPAADWTAKKIWSGQPLPPDHALRG